MKQLFACVALIGFLSSAPAASLKNSSRRAEQNGWIYVHLEGSPAEIGFQNGFQNGFHLALEPKHDTGKDHAFFRAAVEKRLRPKIEPEYRGRACGEEREVGALGRGGAAADHLRQCAGQRQPHSHGRNAAIPRISRWILGAGR